MKPKAGSLRVQIKIVKPLVDWSRIKKTLILVLHTNRNINIRNLRGSITIYSTDIDRIIRKCDGELDGYKLENVWWNGKKTYVHNLSQFTQKEINNLNSSIKDIEYVVEVFPQNKTLCLCR